MVCQAEFNLRNTSLHNYLTHLREGLVFQDYLTIIPQARRGSESISHEAEGRMGNSLRGYEGERNNGLCQIQLIGQKRIFETKHLSLVKAPL